MEEQEVTRFFCPFAKEMCREGNLKLQAEGTVKCEFWISDVSPQRCELLQGISGLKNLAAIASDVHVVAATSGKFR